MHEGISVTASAAFKLERKLQIIANNLANLGNTGFKKDGMVFQEMIPPFNPAALQAAREIPRPFQESNLNVSYVGISRFFTDNSQGSLRPTGNTLDFALEGDGYLVLKTPQGVRYTRDGNFKLDPEGHVINQNGYSVLGRNGKPIKIDLAGGQLSVDASGNISVGRGLENVPSGEFKLVNFENPSALVKEGGGLLRLSSAGTKEKTPEKLYIRQGFLEASNVNPVQEMTEMITTLRAFEAYQKVIQSIDQADDLSVNTLGRIG